MRKKERYTVDQLFYRLNHSFCPSHFIYRRCFILFSIPLFLPPCISPVLNSRPPQHPKNLGSSQLRPETLTAAKTSPASQRGRSLYPHRRRELVSECRSLSHRVGRLLDLARPPFFPSRRLHPLLFNHRRSHPRKTTQIFPR